MKLDTYVVRRSPDNYLKLVRTDEGDLEEFWTTLCEHANKFSKGAAAAIVFSLRVTHSDDAHYSAIQINRIAR